MAWLLVGNSRQRQTKSKLCIHSGREHGLFSWGWDNSVVFVQQAFMYLPFNCRVLLIRLREEGTKTRLYFINSQTDSWRYSPIMVHQISNIPYHGTILGMLSTRKTNKPKPKIHKFPLLIDSPADHHLVHVHRYIQKHAHRHTVTFCACLDYFKGNSWLLWRDTYKFWKIFLTIKGLKEEIDRPALGPGAQSRACRAGGINQMQSRETQEREKEAELHFLNPHLPYFPHTEA